MMGERGSQFRKIKTNKMVMFMENINALDMLERDPHRVSGAWVFKGTRVPVSAFFENLKDGASICYINIARSTYLKMQSN
ncbi:DUF433 domain-containing protein [Spirulina sp. CCNP1310]|uniref:DUF433 domain-containing protein n=1 Tax=Spirulina sp. CCNP1310 TaxID=3110249 RepID=UPI003A4C7587